MSLRYHNDLRELSLRSLRSRDVSTASMSVNFIMHSRVFLVSFQSVHNTLWTMAVVQQQAGLLLGIIYLEQRMKTLSIFFEDEDRGGLQGEGGHGYDSGWMSAEGFILVITIGPCLNCGMKTLQVFF